MKKLVEEPMKEIEKPIRSSNMVTNAGVWYGEWVDALSRKELFALINAANFLNIKELLNLTCCKIATYLHGKKKHEIPPLFGLDPNITFNDEDKKRVYDTYPWVKTIKDNLQKKLDEANKSIAENAGR